MIPVVARWKELMARLNGHQEVVVAKPTSE